MKSAPLIAGASLLLIGALADTEPQVQVDDIDLHHHHHHGHHGHHHHGHHHHGHHHHHHECCEKPKAKTLTKTLKECMTVTQDPCTVTKTCMATATKSCVVTNTCTVKVPEPTTVIKNKVCTVTKFANPTTVTKLRQCTTTVVQSKTLTKCIDRTKTQTQWFPKYTTATATVTVTDPPKCTPQPQKPCCLGNQQQYTVLEGESSSDVAELFNISVDELVMFNSLLASGDDVQAGDVLCVPSDDVMEKRDTAHHHHHKNRPSCEETPDEPSCSAEKKKHHHHHGHHHGHHHHKHHGHHHHHHKHHKHHHHLHHHKATKTTTQIEVVTPRPDLDCNEDSPIHCGLCHAWHNVWPGDTTESIADRYKITRGDVLHLNPWIGSSEKLTEGDWVCVAGCDVPVRFDPIAYEEECAPEHECVLCARPGVCKRSGKHANCPENYSCEKKK